MRLRISQSIIIIALGVILIIFGIASYSYFFMERAIWIFDWPSFTTHFSQIAPLYYAIGYLMGLIILRMMLSQIPFRALKRFIFLFVIIIILLIHILIPVAPYADQMSIFGLGQDIIRGNFSSLFNGEYLSIYPHNLGYVFLLLPFHLILSELWYISAIATIINIMATLLLIHSVCGIYQLLFPKRSPLMVLLLMATSIPLLLMNNILYGDVLGTALFFYGILLYLRFENTKDHVTLARSLVVIGIGNLFRNVGIIFLIAILIHQIFFRKNRWTSVFTSVVSFALPTLLFSVIVSVITKRPFPYFTGGLPIYAWIQMGLNPPLGAWTGYSVVWYWVNRSSDQAAIADYVGHIHWQLEVFGLRGLFEFWFNKMRWLFGEGTYQLELYGIGEPKTAPYNGIGAWLYSTFVTDWLFKSYVRKHIVATQQWIHHFFLLLSMMGAIVMSKHKHILITIAAGFIAFFLLWEMKSRYLFPLLPIFLFFSSVSIDGVLNLFFPRIMIEK